MASLFCCQTTLLPNAFGEETQPSEKTIEATRSGIATVFTSVSQGSGFLIDDSGLILTTSQIVQNGDGHLQVKFDSGEIVQAQLVVNDSEHDIAILRVNLANVSQHKALSLSTTKENLVAVGEKIFCINSLDPKCALKDFVVTGSVIKSDKNHILVDANINAISVGGPLLNLDGQVVGITKATAENSEDVAPEVVPISFATKDIDEAKDKIAKLETPAADLIPDLPGVPFQISDLLKDDPDLFKGRNHKEYNFESKYFSVCVLTPPEGHERLKQAEEVKNKEESKNKNKKSKKAKEKIAENQPVNSKPIDTETHQVYAGKKHYDKAVVTVLVIPRPKYAKMSKGMIAAHLAGSFGVGVAAGALGPAGIALLAVPLLTGSLRDKRAVKGDFLQLSLVGTDDNPVSQPIASGRAPFTKTTAAITDCNYRELIDKSYIGVYTFDARAFDTDQKLKLVISVAGKDKKTNIEFPDRVKKLIVADFSPYWKHVAELNKNKANQM